MRGIRIEPTSVTIHDYAGDQETLQNEVGGAIDVIMLPDGGVMIVDRDYMLKGFQDEKTGNDYLSEQSASGIVEVHWNTWFAGVMSSLMKFVGDMLSGQNQRLMLYIMFIHKFVCFVLLEIWACFNLVYLRYNFIIHY